MLTGFPRSFQATTGFFRIIIQSHVTKALMKTIKSNRLWLGAL
jgi:hypothetical protein